MLGTLCHMFMCAKCLYYIWSLILTTILQDKLRGDGQLTQVSTGHGKGEVWALLITPWETKERMPSKEDTAAWVQGYTFFPSGIRLFLSIDSLVFYHRSCGSKKVAQQACTSYMLSFPCKGHPVTMLTAMVRINISIQNLQRRSLCSACSP